MTEVIDPLAAEFRALASESGAVFDVVPTNAWGRSDPQLLRRVLQNFLANALRYAESGRILLGCRRDRDHLRVEVWDNGPGIPNAERDWIFDAFRRGSGASGQGLGLGLAIAQRMAALLGHEIDLHSWPGRGSVFTIRLPRTARRGPVPELPQPSPRPLPAGSALVLDNEPAALAAMRSLLETWGWKVHASRTPEQALAVAFTPELMILDYHLDAGLTGLDALKSLRARFGDVPAVILTADRDANLYQRLRAVDLNVLYKPLKPLALRQVLLRHSQRGVARN